jgi:hypothetical protein
MQIACYEHQDCDHGIPECQCYCCWEWPTQCHNTYNISNIIETKEDNKDEDIFTQNNDDRTTTTMKVDGPTISKRRLSNDSKSTSNIRLNCTETVCGTIELDSGEEYYTISPRPYNITPQTDHKVYPQLQKAQEPLKALDSHFQILSVNNGRVLHICSLPISVTK